MKVKYVADVVTPADKAGKAGEIRELEEKTAEWLVANGYAEPAEQAANGETGPVLGILNENESSNDDVDSGNADGSEPS